ncbi:hypothetical protein AALA54_16555, partial [Oscillospiraceae bacterium 44-34]
FCYPPPPKNYKISSAFSYNFKLALTFIAAKAEYRQENMTLESADFLLKFCIAENNELGANIPELNSIND